MSFLPDVLAVYIHMHAANRFPVFHNIHRLCSQNLPNEVNSSFSFSFSACKLYFSYGPKGNFSCD